MVSAFDTCAQEYHQFRPDYPPAVFEFLYQHFSLKPSSTILDIGCGTGRAAFPFATQKMRVIGLDPSLEMINMARASAREQHLSIDFIVAQGEQPGLQAHSVDFINCAQAFHWFDAPAALDSFATLLKPGGGFALYWNNRDADRSPYLSDVENLIVKYNPKHKLAYRAKDWGKIINDEKRFGELTFRTFAHEVTLSPDDFIGLTRSFSYVRNALDDQAKIAFEAELRDLLNKVTSNNALLLPYRVELWCARLLK